MAAPSSELARRFKFRTRLLVPATCLLVAAACGGKHAANGQDFVACRLADADRPTCAEIEPYNDDMRLVAISKCHEGGGTVASECPTSELAGVCTTETGKDHQPWEFSKRTRTFYYQVPGAARGPLDVARLREDCERVEPRSISGHWTDGAAQRPAT
jgi:hypothetical protein